MEQKSLITAPPPLPPRRQVTATTGDRVTPPTIVPVERGPVARARRKVGQLVLLPVERIPAREAVRAAFGADALSDLATAFAASAPLAEARRRLAEALPDLAASTPDVADLVQRGRTLDDDVHDAFFAIRRECDLPEYRHVAGVLEGIAAFHADLRDAETTLDDAALARIAHGLEMCFTLATGVVPAPSRLPRHRAGMVDDVDRAARRWLRGHHIMAVLTQGAIVAVGRLIAAVDAGDEAARVEALSAFSLLLDVSADAMSLTGDYLPAIYDRVVRVAMAPPFMPEGFSGVFSSDHRAFARLLRESRGMFEALGRDMPAPHATLVSTMTRLYDNHKQVCGRFVGVDRSSLLMRADAEDTALDQLEKFKRSRLRSLGGCPRG